ncbi:MAG TPA: CDGSH iron-sulfur domain-containing protein [Candidatus Rubneribacter avistercoris]|nr:CDGSH iron-sulfur domain-containing protein [Candidatus Rubneribacter avistercoris]
MPSPPTSPTTHPSTERERSERLPLMAIVVSSNGPYVVRGGVPLIQQAIVPVGGHREYRTLRVFPRRADYALCRCGRSSNPPFCDGAHADAGFEGSETASRMPFKMRADVHRGPSVTLFDDGRCAFARFCHREDGDVWTLTERSDDERLKREAVKESQECPAGRLVHEDSRSGAVLEERLEPSITLLEDPEQGVSGPVFVRGGIALIGADGSAYEPRNRYALCRCGASRNKPFCDAAHVEIGFDDGWESAPSPKARPRRT